MPKAKGQQDDDFDFDVEDGPDEDLEIVDDTPPEDKGREPMPKEVVDEFENDDLEEYSEKVKIRLKQAKKLVHDERREKERVARENTEAISTAQRLYEENKRLKQHLSQGENTLVNTFKHSTDMELAAARQAYKEAYEAGDSDKLLEAQEALQTATLKKHQLDNYKPALQDEEPAVEHQQPSGNPPRPDTKTMAWQERNGWYGADEEMTAAALGLHQKLIKQKGAEYAGSDEYWQDIDTTMHRRFPEYFGDEKPNGKARGTSVVAPASRSRGPKRVTLSRSQVAVAKKLGVTPEQYARELVKLEQSDD